MMIRNKVRMKIGLVCATIQEIEAIIYSLNSYEKKTIYGFIFYENERIIILVSGIGIVNVSAGVMLLIDRFNVDCIINFGTCGAICESLNSGDIVIPPKLFLSDINKEFLLNDKMQSFVFSIALLSDLRVCRGNVFTTTKFMNVQDKLALSKRGMNLIDVIDMESAAIVQICTKDSIKLPVIVTKIVTDTVRHSYESLDDYLRCENALLNSYKTKLVNMFDTIIHTMTS